MGARASRDILEKKINGLPSAGIEPRLIGCPVSCLVNVPIFRKHNPG
jgi:hypothetical protein